jgi:hypothetical protein
LNPRFPWCRPDSEQLVASQVHRRLNGRTLTGLINNAGKYCSW